MPSGQDVGICSHGVWGLEPSLRLRSPRAARASVRLRRGPVRGQPRDPQGLVQNENTGSTVQK